MARYQVDKNRYEELLVGTTMISCSIGTEDILIDTDSDMDLVLIIDKTNTFWRIRNNGSIIASSFSLFPEQQPKYDDCEELDSDSLFEALSEKTNKLMNDSILGEKINEVKYNDVDLSLTFENGILLEVFKASESEDNLPHISLLSGTNI